MSPSYRSGGMEVKRKRISADTANTMTLMELLILLKQVILSPEVLGVTIVIALYINIVSWIVRYRKRPPRPRPVKASAEPKKEDKKKNSDEDDEEEVDEGED